MRYALIALLLAGCATTPTFTDLLGSGYATMDALARTTEELCGAPAYAGGDCVGSISTETRDEAAALLKEALALLDEARLYNVDGSTDIAMQRVQHARAILAVVSRLVEAQA